MIEKYVFWLNMLVSKYMYIIYENVVILYVIFVFIVLLIEVIIMLFVGFVRVIWEIIFIK